MTTLSSRRPFLHAIPFLLAASLWLPAAYAQETTSRGKNDGSVLQLSGGVALPSGPAEFKDGWRTGYQGRLYIGGFASPYVAAGLGLGVHRFALDESALLASAGAVPGVEVTGGAAMIVTPMFELQAHAGQRGFVPFATAGIGLMYIGVSEATVTYERVARRAASTSETHPAFGVGLGLRLPVADAFDVIATVRYERSLGTDETSYVPIGLGLQL